MHHMTMLLRIEPSPFTEAFQSWKALAEENMVKPERNPMVDQKKIKSAKLTTLKVVLVQAQTALMCLFALPLVLFKEPLEVIKEIKLLVTTLDTQ